jgi:phosphoenolpyruvate-protein kinase (PTS system EI component)
VRGIGSGNDRHRQRRVAPARGAGARGLLADARGAGAAAGHRRDPQAIAERSRSAKTRLERERAERARIDCRRSELLAALSEAHRVRRHRSTGRRRSVRGILGPAAPCHESRTVRDRVIDVQDVCMQIADRLVEGGLRGTCMELQTDSVVFADVLTANHCCRWTARWLRGLVLGTSARRRTR